jgi:hypothetical protein
MVCSEESIVGIVTRLWAGRSRVKIMAGGRDFLFFQKVHTSPGAYPASYSMVQGVVSPW